MVIVGVIYHRYLKLWYLFYSFFCFPMNSRTKSIDLAKSWKNVFEKYVYSDDDYIWCHYNEV